MLDRAEEWVTLNRHPAVIRVRIGAARDGTLVAKRLDCWVDTGAYADCGPGVATKLGYAGAGPYRIPNVRVDALELPPGAGALLGPVVLRWCAHPNTGDRPAKPRLAPCP